MNFELGSEFYSNTYRVFMGRNLSDLLKIQERMLRDGERSSPNYQPLVDAIRAKRGN